MEVMEQLDDTEFNESEHNRLINAVTKLDKTQHIKDPTRNEPTNLNSEFNLIKGTSKLDLGNVVRVLENTANHVQISKKLKKTHDNSKVLPKPLEKPQVERIKRSTGYGQAKKKVGRWDAVVARSRTVDYVSFPIKHVSNKMQPTQDYLSKLKLKSPLELELQEIDPPAPVENDEDEEKSYPMTYEDMVEQRQHMAKLRAQQSFKAAKAKRQSKIKSKKYHRILKKEKLKQQLKVFEELQKTNPEEALSKLEALERARALERHTLRHKNTGKWAKSKLIRAKYDKETRAELAEQLAVSRSLTKKAQNEANSDDEEADNDNGIPDITLAQDPLNPWMMQQPDKSNVNAEFDFGYKKYLQEKLITKKKSESDSEEESTEEGIGDQVAATNLNELPASCTIEEFVLREGIGKIAKIENKSVTKPVKAKQAVEETFYEGKGNNQAEPAKVKKVLKKQQKVQGKLVATSNWAVESINDNGSAEITPKENIYDVFDSLETDIMGQVEKKLKNLRHNIERLERSTKERKGPNKATEGQQDNLEYLGFKNQKVKPVIDEQLTETTTKTPIAENTVNSPVTLLESTKLQPQNALHTSEANIEPSGFIEAKPKFLNSAISEGVNEYDQLDDDEQVVPKVNIEGVFEEDDVVAIFRQEKEEEAKKDTPQDIDLSLPGWGSWGGKGVKAQKRKKNRFILKAPPKMPRRDENKGDIIIKEYKDPKLSVHKVKEVPFPFTSVKEYEASIRAPLGNTFIPEKAHKLLIRPSVITKAGTIIEPMDEDELLVRKNKIFKNEDIIKLLAKK